jgi:hypothetical protein
MDGDGRYVHCVHVVLKPMQFVTDIASSREL